MFLDSLRLAEQQKPTGIDLTDLVGHWKLNQNGADATGNGHTAVENGTIAYAAGKINFAYDADGGGTDYLRIAHHADFVVNTGGGVSGDLPLSIDCWVKFDDLTNAWFVNKRESHAVNNNYAFIYSGGDLIFATAGSNVNYYQVNHTWTPTIGQWYHVATTYDGLDSGVGSRKLYIDKVAVSVTETEVGTYAGMTTDTPDIFIGSGGFAPTLSSYHLNGQIQSVKIWKKELSLSDIEAIYNKENGGEYIDE